MTLHSLSHNPSFFNACCKHCSKGFHLGEFEFSKMVCKSLNYLKSSSATLTSDLTTTGHLVYTCRWFKCFLNIHSLTVVRRGFRLFPSLPLGSGVLPEKCFKLLKEDTNHYTIQGFHIGRPFHHHTYSRYAEGNSHKLLRRSLRFI